MSDRLARRPSEPRHLVDPDDLVSLAEEVMLLRSVIRRLAANGGIPAPMLKGLTELRQQVLALGSTLRTQRALAETHDDQVSSAFARVLEDLGDELELAE